MIGYLGLGSNVGERQHNLDRACELLNEHGARVVAHSSLYETEPQGEFPDQDDFLNCCVEIETDLAPEDLLDACKVVEREGGRMVAGPRHGPRPIDVDVLLLGDLTYESDRLTIPHRDVTTRRFVLEPLLELNPHLTLPDGTRLADCLDAVRDQRVERAE